MYSLDWPYISNYPETSSTDRIATLITNRLSNLEKAALNFHITENHILKQAVYKITLG
jgi:hypothetical protein